MFLTPAAVLGVWIRGLLSIVIVGAGLWLIYQWYDGLPSAISIRVESEEISKTDLSELPEQNFRMQRLTPVQRLTTWRPGFDRSTTILVCGTLLLMMSIAGRWLHPSLMFLNRKEALPKMPIGESHQLNGRDGSQLHVKTYGSTNLPTIILTHGWVMNHQEWAHLVTRLQDKFRLIAWDLPGLGKSTQPRDGDYRLEKMAEDLRAVVEFSGTKPVTLMGHSIGGMITLTLCRLFPHLLGSRVNKLILVHTTYTNPLRTTAWSTLYTALQKPVIEPLLYLQIAISPFVWLMTWMSYWNGSVHSSTMRNGFSRAASRSKLNFAADFTPYASPAVLARGGLSMLQYDATATLPKINVPVLLIAADKDPLTTAEASEYMRTALPSAKLLTMHPAKHFGMLEYDLQFANAVKEFCKEQSEPLKNVVKELKQRTTIV